MRLLDAMLPGGDQSDFYWWAHKSARRRSAPGVRLQGEPREIRR